MKNNFLIFLILIGFFSLLSCEKDETKAVLLTNPSAPAITKAGDLVLKRAEASNQIIIAGTTADYGFPSSVKYTLEADLANNQFKTPILLGVANVDTFKFTVFELNNVLIKILPVDKLAALELRVKAVLVSGSASTKPIEVISATTKANITTYGPPTLIITGDANSQGIISPTDNGKYTGWIYTNGTAFTFTNKDNGKVYGGVNGTLSLNGAAIKIDAGGYDFKVDINTMKYEFADVTIGIIGDAVGGWNNDTKMTYNFADKSWNIRTKVTAGGIKFRTTGGWSAVNVAYDPAGHDLNNLYQANSRPGAGDSQNIDDIAPGTYDIKAFLSTTPMKAKFTLVAK